MTEEQRDWQDDQGKVGDPEAQGQGAAADLLKKGISAANKFVEGLQIPAATTGTVVGTVLGCLTLRAFTKAWPRLETPVKAAGYLVGGYAAYRLAKAAFDQGVGERAPELEGSAECGQA